MTNGTKTAHRIFYIDNLRIYLIVLVLLHHVSIGYGGSGGWRIKEAASDSFSPIVFLIFNAVNQSYFMSFFYLIAGYFLRGSYDAKGAGKCMKDRLIRLGLPILFYGFVISPVIAWIVENSVGQRPVSLAAVMQAHIDRRLFSIGPLWFVEGLLIFSAIYIVLTCFRERRSKPPGNTAVGGDFPTSRSIIAAMIFMAVLTFAVRIGFPVGTYVYHFQLGHFVHYAFCFSLGGMAFRRRWFERLTDAQANRWALVAIVNTGIFPIVVGFALWTGIGEEKFIGGFTAASFFLSAWESVNCLSIMIALTRLFQKRFNRQGTILKAMSANAYTVYVIHETVVISLMAMMLTARLHTVWKFVFVSSAGIAGSFLIAHFIIRRLPGMRRVLG